MPDSFVVCSSRQILELSQAERDHLDSAEFVIVCNSFLEHWKIAGFRPTTWAMGDTENAECCDDLARQLRTIRDDAELRRRVRGIFVCVESPQALQVVHESGVPVTLYRRGHWSNERQSFAKTLFEPLYHRSTGVDLINLAMILNTGGVIKLLGCQRGINTGHFYDPQREDSAPGTLIEWPMWTAFSEARQQGWNMIDCNIEHDPAIPDTYGIPRGSIL